MNSTNNINKRYGVPPVEPCQAGGGLGSSKAQSTDTEPARSGTSRWFLKGARKQGKQKRKDNRGPRKRPQYNLSSHQQHKEQRGRIEREEIEPVHKYLASQRMWRTTQKEDRASKTFQERKNPCGDATGSASQECQL